MQTLQMLLLVVAVHAQRLALGDGVNRAVISTACSAQTPAYTYVGHKAFEAVAKVGLKNVAFTCADRAATEPCASDSQPDWPPLFYCHFEWGVEQRFGTGPVIANASAIRLPGGGELLAVETFATCPLPPLAEFSGIGTLTITLTHGAASGESAITLPWEGVPGGNVINVFWASSPSLPPLSPPHAPPAPSSPPGTPSSILPAGISGPHIGYCSSWTYVTGGQSGGVNEPPLQPGDPDYAMLHNPNVVQECYARCMVNHPESRCFWLNVPSGASGPTYWANGVPVGTELCGCSSTTSHSLATTADNYRAYYW